MTVAIVLVAIATVFNSVHILVMNKRLWDRIERLQVQCEYLLSEWLHNRKDSSG